MVDRVEELGKIHIGDMATAVLKMGLCVFQRIVLGSSRPEAEAIVRECRIPNGLEHLRDGLLDQLIFLYRSAGYTCLAYDG